MLSPQHGNEQLDIRVAYISFLARLTLKEGKVNSEYHASSKYRFMVFFVLPENHEQLFQTFRRGLDIDFTFVHQPYFEQATYE